jgi:hydroxymethylpyrimidine pyrophosphatase-like HAD family hydrolase
MFPKESISNIDLLRKLNRERLQILHTTPIAAVAFDMHGFVYGEDHPLNGNMLEAEAHLLKRGCVLAAVTGFGDRIHLFQGRPLLPHLEQLGLKPEELPLYFSTRNGALTTHAYTDEVLDAHPLTEEMYEAITSHPLISAIKDLTSRDVKAAMVNAYRSTQQLLGFPLHPHRMEHLGIRHDWHPGTRSGYQLTVYYEPQSFMHFRSGDYEYQAIRVLQDHSDGLIPQTAQVMAPIIKTVLKRDKGIDVSVNTAASHPEIDIARSEVNKGLGCKAILPRIAARWGITEAEARQFSVGGGDSPKQNDQPLVEYFGFGVTNVDYYSGGRRDPVVLDYPGISGQLERTLHFMQNIRMLAD